MVDLSERGPDVYRFHPAVLAGAVLLAVFLQSAMPLYVPFPQFLSLLELPFLVVLYFSFSRRSPSTGLLLGLGVGVLQDALSHNPIGLYGMAKTLVGFAASSLSARVDTDPPHARLLLVFGFYFFHQVAYALVEQLLLARTVELVNLTVLEAALVNALLGVIIFPLLDRFRRVA